jgi:hypothetical protein
MEGGWIGVGCMDGFWMAGGGVGLGAVNMVDRDLGKGNLGSIQTRQQ